MLKHEAYWTPRSSSSSIRLSSCPPRGRRTFTRRLSRSSKSRNIVPRRWSSLLMRAFRDMDGVGCPPALHTTRGRPKLLPWVVFREWCPGTMPISHHLQGTGVYSHSQLGWVTELGLPPLNSSPHP